MRCDECMDRRDIKRDELFPRLLTMLKAALEAMKDDCDNRDGLDTFGLSCPNCHGVPLPHSLGCQIEDAILQAEKVNK